MKVIYSDQYDCVCVRVEPGDDSEDVIGMCRDIGALRLVDGEEFVVELREDVGPELWTEGALRRSLEGSVR